MFTRKTKTVKERFEELLKLSNSATEQFTIIQSNLRNVNLEIEEEISSLQETIDNLSNFKRELSDKKSKNVKVLTKIDEFLGDE